MGLSFLLFWEKIQIFEKNTKKIQKCSHDVSQCIETQFSLINEFYSIHCWDFIVIPGAPKYLNSFKNQLFWTLQDQKNRTVRAVILFLKHSKILIFDQVMGLWNSIRVAICLGHWYKCYVKFECVFINWMLWEVYHE